MLTSLLLLLVAFGYVENNMEMPEVITKSGKIRGSYKQSANGKQVAVFEGIPYAQAPVGQYRFKEPQRMKRWVGAWLARRLRICTQYNHFSGQNGHYQVIGDEDCLHLNVYSPDLNATKLLDVVISIHGGAFMYGYGHFTTFKHLADLNIVLVTINYRLGPLGFLSTEDSVVPGNNGLKDQNMAMQWVQDNIRYFGGNRDSVTLFGLSAGGASVQYHIMSRYSVDLFHRAIMTSGCALNNWAQAEGGLEKAKIIANHVGCDNATTEEMVECLRTIPDKQIVEATKLLQKWLYNPFSPFAPVVDYDFVPNNPNYLLTHGPLIDVPTIISVTQSEGLYPGSEFVNSPEYLKHLEHNWNEIAPFLLDYNYTVAQTDKNMIATKAKKEYLKDKPISEESANDLIQLIGDRLFVADIEKAARNQAKTNTQPVYFYYFSYRGNISVSEILSNSTKDFGTCHADDLIYITSFRSSLLETESDKEMNNVMKEMWSSFTKTGKPEIRNASWTQVAKSKKSSFEYLHIASPSNITMQRAEYLGHREFWQSLPFNENDKFKNSSSSQ